MVDCHRRGSASACALLVRFVMQGTVSVMQGTVSNNAATAISAAIGYALPLLALQAVSERMPRHLFADARATKAAAMG
jgi:hypothetical protein